VEAGVFDGFLRSGIDRMLPDVHCPVFLASGVHGPGESMDTKFGARMAELLPRAEVVELVGLNHFGPMQDPVTLAASIVECFSRLG